MGVRVDPASRRGDGCRVGQRYPTSSAADPRVDRSLPITPLLGAPRKPHCWGRGGEPMGVQTGYSVTPVTSGVLRQSRLLQEPEAGQAATPAWLPGQRLTGRLWEAGFAGMDGKRLKAQATSRIHSHTRGVTPIASARGLEVHV